MSVAVKGMEMPENCNVCEFAHWSTLDQMAYCKAKKLYDVSSRLQDKESGLLPTCRTTI